MLMTLCLARWRDASFDFIDGWTELAWPDATDRLDATGSTVPTPM
jgi:hypothetical protein